MTVVLKTGWKKCGNHRVRTLVKADTPSAIRQSWFRRIFINSRRGDAAASPPTHS